METRRDFSKLVADYAEILKVFRQSRYMDYPKELSFETLTRCNAECWFCPSPTLERTGHKMPDVLIAKILRDLRDGMPADLPFIVSPFKVNEPLLDVRIFDILFEINARLPQATIRLFTNGSPLTLKHVGYLASVKNMEHLWVSLNECDPEKYEQTMKLPLKKTLANLDMLHQACAAGAFTHKVFVSRVCDETEEDQVFERFVRERYPLFGIGVMYRSEWLGEVSGLEPNRAVPMVGCARWYELSITSTGEVAFCCMDGKPAFPIGNVANENVLDIYNKPDYRKFREQFVTRLEGSPCLNCTGM
jgi:hypothetical protein